MKKKVVFIMMLIMVLSGSYTCTTNAASNSTPEPPGFTARPADQIVWEDETIRIDAVLKGTPTPVVYWYKEGEAVNTNPRITMTYKDGRASLKITNAKLQDTGTYSIIALSSVGSAQANCKIIVAKK